jgi:streptogrisin C
VSITLLRPTLTLLFAAVTAVAFALPPSAIAPALTAASAASATTDAAGVESSLRSTLGTSYAYSWLDGDKLVVGITDASRANEVRAAGAEPRVLKHSAAKLDGIKSRFDSQWTTVPDAVAGWGVDAVTNSVVVYVVGSDPAAHAFADAARAGSDAVRVEVVTEAAKPYWDIIGGQPIYTGSSRCSVGFNARSGSTRYVITAGHCTNIGTDWTGVGGTLGATADSSFPSNDYGIIQVTSSSAKSTPLVDRYSSGSDVTVTGPAGSSIGQPICRSGSTTGWRCGTVTGMNQTVNYGGGLIVHGLTRTSACAQPGDSGGPFVSNPGSGSQVTARGTTSGGSGDCSVGGTTFFQPVNEVLSRYGLTLYTG